MQSTVMTEMQSKQQAMQQQFMDDIGYNMDMHADRLSEMNELLVKQGSGEALQARITEELRESFEDQRVRAAATQAQLTEELRESIAAQRVMLSKAEACSELAA